jgi:hypothetical protein
LKDMAERVRNVGVPDIASLVQLAEILLERLPDRSFGQFVRRNMSVFICTAAPESKSVEIAKRTLISTGDPAVADVLGVMGKENLVSELRSREPHLPGRERFLAAVIDGWRRASADAPDQFQKEIQPFVSAKAPVVAIAARAGLAQQRPKDRNKFDNFLLRSLQNDQDESVREWLLRNPEFANHLRTDRASIQALRAVLDAYRSKRPAQALEVISQVLGGRSGKEPQRYWEEALRALATIGGNEADRIFSRFLLERIERGEGQQIRDFVAREPALSLLRKTFWSLLEKATNEREWEVLFDIYCNRTTELELVRLIDAAHERNAQLSAWISKRLVPKLLTNELLSPVFHRSITSRDAIATIAKDLGRDTLEDFRYIHTFAENWVTTRAATKQKLQLSIQTGLRIALQHAVPGSSLHSQLSSAVRAVEDWGAADSPKLNPSIGSLASSDPPHDIAASDESVGQIFRGVTPGSKDFALIAGMNPWIIDLILQREPGPWPKPEILLDQITTRFVYTAQLRKRAEEDLQNLGQTVRIELAMALRDTLSDLESELAGYFIFRDVLDQCGLHPVMARLGEIVEQKDLSSEKHKLVRDSERRGRLRVFGLGIQVDDKTVGSGLIMNSGDNDDRY